LSGGPRDDGGNALDNVYAYYGVGQGGKVAMVNALPTDETVLEVPTESVHMSRLSGLAVRNALIALALPNADTVALGDAKQRKLLGRVDVAAPRGVAFDAQRRLLVISNGQLVRYNVGRNNAALTNREVLVDTGLDEPRRITLGRDGRIYVGDWGQSHQVKVFDDTGKRLMTLGEPGGPTVGKYNPKRMHNPKGMAVLPNGELWVAEHNNAPRRVSVWSTEDGSFIRAMYGPSSYGGGGRIDPKDETRFYYAPYSKGAVGMEFKLDWEKGTSELVNVYARDGHGTAFNFFREQAPQYPVYVNGRQYMTTSFNANRTAGSPMMGISLMEEDGVARPVAAIMRPRHWNIFEQEEFRALLPSYFHLDHPGRGGSGGSRKDQLRHVAVWSDLNDDHAPQVDEVQVRQLPAMYRSFVVQDDLSVISSHTDTIRPHSFTEGGAPIYRAEDFHRSVENFEEKTEGVRQQAITTPDGWTIVSDAPQRGFKNGEKVWTYPSRWPSLHASHHAPKPQHPGQMIGTTRMVGPAVTPGIGEAGPIWGINGNAGVVYLMTSDGLFVDTLGKDGRLAPNWGHNEATRQATRGLLLNDVSLVGESFFPTLNGTSDGNVYLVAGKAHSSIVRLDGFDSVRRLQPRTLTISRADYDRAKQYHLRREQRRQETRGQPSLTVRMRDEAPTLDGKLDDWRNASWAEIEKGVQAALCVTDERLYVAYSTTKGDLLSNGSPSLRMLFKHGGALDLQLGTDPNAAGARGDPVVGDLRLLVTRRDGKLTAALYRPEVPGTPKDKRVAFQSPQRTIYFDAIEDVTEQVELASDHDVYEFSIPLDTLGLDVSRGMTLTGDFGVLRGRKGETYERLYWSNKATNITEDVPSEAMLRPALWGRLRFQ